jgi:hypothetical protein
MAYPFENPVNARFSGVFCWEDVLCPVGRRTGWLHGGYAKRDFLFFFCIPFAHVI